MVELRHLLVDAQLVAAESDATNPAVAESDAHPVLQVAAADLGLHLASWCARPVPEVAQPDEPVLAATVEFVALAQSAQLVNPSKVHQVGLAARMKLRDSPHHRHWLGRRRSFSNPDGGIPDQRFAQRCPH